MNLHSSHIVFSEHIVIFFTVNCGRTRVPDKGYKLPLQTWYQNYTLLSGSCIFTPSQVSLLKSKSFGFFVVHILLINLCIKQSFLCWIACFMRLMRKHDPLDYLDCNHINVLILVNILLLFSSPPSFPLTIVMIAVCLASHLSAFYPLEKMVVMIVLMFGFI